MRALKTLAVAGLLASSLAQAAPIFNDDFDANGLGLNAVPTGWSVSGGTVDIIGSPSFYDLIPGSGRYIDLDGSTGSAGLLSTSFSLAAGTTYLAEFDLAGNFRNSDAESVTVNFGTASLTASLPIETGWTAYALYFTPSASGSYSLSFQNAGGDNVGMLLDNVSIAAVPEPGTLAMLLSGFGMIGLIARRRSRA